MEFKIANTAYLEELSSGNTTIIQQIVELFLDQTPGDMDLLVSHIQQQDWDAAYKQAHYLKPTLVYVGANDLHKQITDIEQLAKGREELDTLPDRMVVILPELEILYAELTAYLQTISQ